MHLDLAGFLSAVGAFAEVAAALFGLSERAGGRGSSTRGSHPAPWIATAAATSAGRTASERWERRGGRMRRSTYHAWEGGGSTRSWSAAAEAGEGRREALREIHAGGEALDVREKIGNRW
jgi:hypothetical protein